MCCVPVAINSTEAAGITAAICGYLAKWASWFPTQNLSHTLPVDSRLVVSSANRVEYRTDTHLA